MQLAAHRIEAPDAARVQPLFEADPAFFEMTEGAAARPDEAALLFTDAPPGRGPEHKQVFLLDDAAVVELLIGHPDETTWYLGLIFLAPSARGRGLGTQLLDAVADHVRAQGATAVRLAVVAENAAARRLYERLGYSLVARRPRTTWTGAVIQCDVMELKL